MYWLSQLGGWFIYWLVLTFVNILLNGAKEEKEGLWNEQIGLTVFLIIGLFFTHTYRLFVKKRNWVSLPVGKLITRIIISVLVLSIAILVSYILVLFALGVLEPANLDDELLLLRIFINVSIIISLWIATYFSVQYFRNYRMAQVHRLTQDALLKEATLNKLRSQLNPHFIFNSLNSIRALVSVDPEKARDSITALANIFRKTLQLDKAILVSFKEELQIVEDYLKLEKIRFEERLEYSFEFEDGIFNTKVPPLMLQTLVENGIKHGISTLPKGGFLKVKGIIDGEKAIFTICNSGVLITDKRSKGYGLKNTRERLQLLYDGRGSITLEAHSETSVLTTLVLPKQ